MVGRALATKSHSLTAARRASTSSGSGTKAWRTPTTAPILTFSPRKSSSFDSLSLAQDDLEAALEQFREIASDVGRPGVETKKEWLTV